MANSDEECDIRPGTVTPKKLPKQSGGGGHEFVTELPEAGDEGVEYVLMDDISDCTTYRGTYIYDETCGGWICTSGSGGGSIDRYTFEQTATGWRAKRNNTVIFTYVDKDTIDSYEDTATGFQIIRGGSVIFTHTDKGSTEVPEYTAESTPTGWQLFKDGQVIFTYVDKNDEYVIEDNATGWDFKKNGDIIYTYVNPTGDPSDGTYFTSGVLTTVITGTSTVAASSVTGLTLADVVIGETLIYDEAGSVGRVTAVNGSNLTVETITTAPGERRGTRLGAVDDYTDLPATCAAATALGWQTPLAGDFAYVREDSSHDDHLCEWVISNIDNSCNITWAYSHTLNAGNYVLDIYKYGDYPSGNPIPKNADGSVTLPKDEDTTYDFETTTTSGGKITGWKVKDHDTGTVLYTYVDQNDNDNTTYDFEDVTVSGSVTGWRVKDHDTGTVLFTHTDVGDTTYDFEAVTVGGVITGWRVKDGKTGTVLFTYTDLNDLSDGSYFTSETLDTGITNTTTVPISTVTGLSASDVVDGETLIYDGDGSLGVVTSHTSANLTVETMTISGSGDASSFVYNTTDTIAAAVGNASYISLTDLYQYDGTTTPVTSDIILGKTLAYDAAGTIGLATAISGSTVTFTTISVAGSGGGGTTYNVNMRGDEMRYADALISPTRNSNWTVVDGRIPFVNRTGSTITQPSAGVWTIPAHTTVKVILSIGLYANGSTKNLNGEWYVRKVGDNKNNAICYVDPYDGEPTVWALNDTASGIFNNDTDSAVQIEAYCEKQQGENLQVYSKTSQVTITEIGRVVDPVKYIDNSDGLQDSPVGNIISYMGNNTPKHYLDCDGTVYNVGDYPELEAHFITEFGAIDYFGGNAAQNTWAVPDLRGEFLRGTGENSHETTRPTGDTGTYKQGSGENVGVHQDATETPSVYSYGNGIGTMNGTNRSSANGYPSKVDSVAVREAYYSTVQATWTPQTSNPAGGVYTARPTNTSVKYCIKCESNLAVIAGDNNQYKVHVPFSVTPSTAGAVATLNVSSADAKGNISLINTSNNSFVAPVDGWYLFSAKSRQTDTSSAGRFVSYWRKNGDTGHGGTFANDDGYVSKSLQAFDYASTIYLAAGEYIQLSAYGDNGFTSTAFTGELDVVQLTAPTNVYAGDLNLIAADRVYSTDEQLIGSYLGKPLYSKTWSGLSITTSNGSWKDLGISVASLNVEKIVETELRSAQDKSAFDNSLVRITSGNNISVWSQGYSIVLDSLTLYYTKSTDTAGSAPNKNSLLLTRPDLWTPGTEYDFGGGLYGKRLKGTNTWNYLSGGNLIIASSVAKTAKVFNKGGMVDMSGTAGTNWYDINGVWNGNDWFRPLATNTSQTLRFYCSNNQGGTTGSVQYDVWFTYTKS